MRRCSLLHALDIVSVFVSTDLLHAGLLGSSEDLPACLSVCLAVIIGWSSIAIHEVHSLRYSSMVKVESIPILQTAGDGGVKRSGGGGVDVE